MQILLNTLRRSIPGLLRFLVCALILFFAFALSAWVIIGPFHMKFRTFASTLECLFSLINGDDMYVTFSIVGYDKGPGIFLISRIFLYIFITLFIYVVLNIFVTIIFEAYEEVKVVLSVIFQIMSSPSHAAGFRHSWHLESIVRSTRV